MKIHFVSDFYDQLGQGSVLIDEQHNSYKIHSLNDSKNKIKFVTIDSQYCAKKLTNTKLFQTKQQTKQQCSLSNKEYFYFDILECNIIENSVLLGKVVNIDRFNDSDYLLVKTSSQLVEDKLPKDFLIPYVDDYILSVNISNKTIEVKNSLLILENS